VPTPEDTLKELGLELPPVVKPVAAYVPAVRTGNLVYVSGQVPMRDGKLLATGKLGGDVEPDTGIECARQCALNALAALNSVAPLGDVTRIVKVLAFIASTPDFTGQPQIANGASELFGQVLGPAGAHARSAIGVPVLPLDAPVEVELIAEVAWTATGR
jgi:enamine deaminase RidA (YjgF/YER057c/UK114 family)